MNKLEYLFISIAFVLLASVYLIPNGYDWNEVYWTVSGKGVYETTREGSFFTFLIPATFFLFMYLREGYLLREVNKNRDKGLDQTKPRQESYHKKQDELRKEHSSPVTKNELNNEDPYKIQKIKRYLEEIQVKYRYDNSLEENLIRLNKYLVYKEGLIKLKNELKLNSIIDEGLVLDDIESFIEQSSEKQLYAYITKKSRQLYELYLENDVRRYKIIFSNDKFITYDNGKFRSTIMFTELEGVYSIENNYLVIRKPSNQQEFEVIKNRYVSNFRRIKL